MAVFFLANVAFAELANGHCLCTHSKRILQFMHSEMSVFTEKGKGKGDDLFFFNGRLLANPTQYYYQPKFTEKISETYKTFPMLLRN